ncbi:MAG TPA: ester cyclase [Euzebya sp.]|nr:ester cyclase [Euzebya sp.]
MSNLDLVHRGIGGILNQADYKIADEIFTPDFVFHTPAREEPFRGPAGFKEYVSTIRSAFPDIRFTVEDSFEAPGDKAVARWSATLTHLGEFFGIPPTRKKATLRGIHIYQCRDGRIAEEWQELDALNLMRQLGALPNAEKIPKPVLKLLLKFGG